MIKSLEQYILEEAIRNTIHSRIPNGCPIPFLPGVVQTLEVIQQEDEDETDETVIFVELHNAFDGHSYLFPIAEIRSVEDAEEACEKLNEAVMMFVGLIEGEEMEYADAYTMTCQTVLDFDPNDLDDDEWDEDELRNYEPSFTEMYGIEVDEDLTLEELLKNKGEYNYEKHS